LAVTDFPVFEEKTLAISKKMKIAVAVIIAIVVIVAGAAYFITPAPPPAPEIAVYGLTSPDVVVFWDPSESFSNEIVVMHNIYETLLRWDPTTEQFIPVLATSWEASADALTWTFKLREGVKFHTGREMDATAVKRAIERTIQLGLGASYIWSGVKEIRAVDKYTVQFTLDYPIPVSYIAASAYGSFIFDPVEAQEKGKEWFEEGHDAGTGPYMVESWSKAEDQVILTKFPDYWGGWEGKHFDKVIIRAIPESVTARQLLEAGQVDFLDDLPFEDVADLKTNPKIEVVTTPSFQNLLFFFNTERPPMDNKLVRQALSYAFPYQQVIDHVMGGYATQSRGPIPKGMWAHFDDLPQYTYDINKARDLLAQAGYAEVGFKLVLTYNAGDENERRTAELYKAELAKLNIELDIRGMPWEQQWDMAKSPDPEARQDIFVMYWWPDIAADPYTFLFNMFHSEDTPFFGMSYYKNPEFDRLIDEGFSVTATDLDQAKRDYKEAQRMLIDDAAAIFVYDQMYVRLKLVTLKGYVDNPTYPHVVFFYYTWREA